MLKNNLFIFIFVFLSSCVYLPAVVEDRKIGCNLITKQYKLSSDNEYTENLINTKKVLDKSCLPGACDSGVLVVLGVATIPTITFVVSGSIVLVGNTLHWLEIQGKCEKNYLTKQAKEFRNKPYIDTSIDEL